MHALQVENIFEQIDIVYEECKKLQFYSADNHPSYKLNLTENSWPGLRTLELGKINKLFKYFFVKYLEINHLIDFKYDKEIDMFLHARLENDKNNDWIHTDEECKKACLIYLSPTNLNSGTRLYSGDKQIISDFKFVQNRAVLYSGNYFHMAYGHHGNSIDNCRLTLNIFIN